MSSISSFVGSGKDGSLTVIRPQTAGLRVCICASTSSWFFLGSSSVKILALRVTQDVTRHATRDSVTQHVTLSVSRDVGTTGQDSWSVPALESSVVIG